MSRMLNISSNNHFRGYSLAFLLMTIPPIFMYAAAVRNEVVWIWILLSLVVLGNILALLTR